MSSVLDDPVRLYFLTDEAEAKSGKSNVKEKLMVELCKAGAANVSMLSCTKQKEKNILNELQFIPWGT